MAAGGGRSMEESATSIIHIIGKWLTRKNKSALYEALVKIKSELMLLGFISLLLTVLKGTISEICLPKAIGNSWLPCDKDFEEEHENDFDGDDGHIKLLFFTNLTRTSHHRSLAAAAYVDKYSERYRFARDMTFGRRHLNIWCRSPVLIWIVCFFRQFLVSVPKVDYLTI
ncbi:hypothetical protein POM88_007416 [Heracleum sosnowskyi]|uniref:Uncharacterized protein n=1 Tax=Heracleum sosnowskyi TaxID=360622 RepID=A0AAD8J5D3_9APIA|nr:hypothetical protein POM88_007416 [Heracleum sosnowskyi]